MHGTWWQVCRPGSVPTRWEHRSNPLVDLEKVRAFAMRHTGTQPSICPTQQGGALPARPFARCAGSVPASRSPTVTVVPMAPPGEYTVPPCSRCKLLLSFLGRVTTGMFGNGHMSCSRCFPSLFYMFPWMRKAKNRAWRVFPPSPNYRLALRLM